MTESKIREMLNQTDFSTETDLRQRLYEKLFANSTKIVPMRRALSDDDLDQLYAAGETVRPNLDTLDPFKLP